MAWQHGYPPEIPDWPPLSPRWKRHRGAAIISLVLLVGEVGLVVRLGVPGRGVVAQGCWLLGLTAACLVVTFAVVRLSLSVGRRRLARRRRSRDGRGPAGSGVTPPTPPRTDDGPPLPDGGRFLREDGLGPDTTRPWIHP